MDLASLNAADACEAVFDLELRHPASDEPLGLFIAHKGMNAREVQAVARKQGNEILKESFEAQRKAKDAKAPTIEDSAKRTSKLLAAATVGWFEMKDGKRIEGFPFGKERLQFSSDEAEKLYDNPGYAWLRQQLDESVGDIGNFMKP